MKRWSWIILVVGVAALLAGCGSASSTAVTSTDDVQRISPERAKAMQEAGEAVLLDTRSLEAYQAQHAKGAVSFPEEDLAARFQELPDDAEKALIFY
jgi:3-mercaptopyruvate sulfurtransferase SseA